MSFYLLLQKYKDLDFSKTITGNFTGIIHKDILTPNDYFALISPQAVPYLEQMAQRAHTLTKQFFGRTIQLYTPIYLANYCENKCSYCSFNVENKIKRKKLTTEEIQQEAINIYETGLRHVLILTGESRSQTPVDYIRDSVKILKKYFDSVSIEIYPLTEEEYEFLVDAGIDGLTIYQEVYNEAKYEEVHLAGPKKDYAFRIDAPERACKARMRTVSIGALLGLDDWRKEIFFTGLHAKYLQDKYSDVEISVSLPRIKPHIGKPDQYVIVSDRDMVQMMLALRIFLPRVGVNISTRENAALRENLIPLGVTKLSAGVSTEVGGHITGDKSDSQFEIADKSSVEEVKKMILSKGYQPVFTDWIKAM